MTANELAEKIENYCYWSIIDFHYIKEAADMLRKQQEKIEALKLRELTDEEIAQEWGNFCPNVLEFARAILRKSQEPLCEKFEKVLNDNLWEMLEEDGEAQEK